MKWQNGSGQLVTTEQLLSAYSALNSTVHSDCDSLFQNFGPGNIKVTDDPFLHVIDRPYERLSVYEHILHELQLADNIKYDQIHKGTPYFFISWLAFTSSLLNY